MSDIQRVRVLAAASLVVLGALAVVRVFALPSVAPRINIRWADSVSEPERRDLEQQFRLSEGERREGSTWAYDLRDPSWMAVRALIVHPAVADTHHINRRLGMVASNAPRGTTRLPAGGLTGWRDSPLVEWAGRLAFSVFVVAVLWLVTTGRIARPETSPQILQST